MKKIYIALLLCLFAMPAMAQISLTRALFESARGKTYTSASYDLESNLPTETLLNIIAQNGTNVTYDFRSIPFPANPTYTGTTRTLNLGESHPFPGEAGFAEANYITEVTTSETPDTTLWSYIKLSDDEYRVLGGGFVHSGGSEAYSNFGIEIFQKLPQTYGTEWENVLTFMEIPGVGSITSKMYYSIDSWGTLLLPGGRSASALRMKVESETILDLSFPIPGYEPQPRTVVTYNYMTLGNFSASISVDPEGNPTDVSYSLTDGEMGSSIGKDADLPEGFELGQNYPNPFNPSTTIGYSIPFAADVTLTVVDMTGRTVATIAQPRQTAGPHSVTFDAQNLGSGIYIYRLDAGGYSISKKFTLIK